jgi:hypothetical protein
VIVFDLKCGHGHVFEAWFGSSDAYEDQRAAAMIACPMCGDTGIGKAVMAPNVAPKGNRAQPAPMAKDEAAAPPPEAVKAALAAMAAAQAKVLETSEYVGMAFTDRARAMHVGDEPVATIHGQATAEQAKALLDEGVAVAPLPFPVVPPEARN